MVTLPDRHKINSNAVKLFNTWVDILQNFECSTHNWSSQQIYVLIVLTMRTAVFRDLTPCRLVGVYRHVRGSCRLCHQAGRWWDHLKHQYSSIRLCGTTSQNTAIFVQVHNLFLCPEGKIPYFSDHKMHQTIRHTMIFSLAILEKNNDECISILVIYWKKTGLVHTKISNHNIIYSS